MGDLTTTKDAGFSLRPTNFEQAVKLAEMMANSDLVPKDYKGKPGNVLIAVQMGQEVGLAPMQAIQNIAVINGRPSMWGDAVKAVVLASPLCEYVEETFDRETMTATCVSKRRGAQKPMVTTFSKSDAETAKLWNKEGPWKTNPSRMLQMRARGFNLRDNFADVLRGIQVVEEARDILDVTPDRPAGSRGTATTLDELAGRPTKVEEAKDVEVEEPGAPKMDLDDFVQAVAEAGDKAGLLEVGGLIADSDLGDDERASVRKLYKQKLLDFEMAEHGVETNQEENNK